MNGHQQGGGGHGEGREHLAYGKTLLVIAARDTEDVATEFTAD